MLGLVGEQLPLLGVVGEQGDGAAELVARRVGAADDDRLHHHHQLVRRQPVALLLGRDQVGEQVLGRLVAAIGDQLPRVLVELVLGGGDDRQVLVEVAVEDAQHVGGPPAEQLPVLLRRAEQLADDGDRIRLADVDGEVGAPGRGDGIDQPADHLTHERPQPVGRPRRERLADEPAQPGVLLALCRQDRRPPPGEVLLVGHPVQLHDLATSRCATACRATSRPRRRSGGSRSRTDCGRSSSSRPRPGARSGGRSWSPRGRPPASASRGRTRWSAWAAPYAGGRQPAKAASGSTYSTPRNSATGALVTLPPTVLTP